MQKLSEPEFMQELLTTLAKTAPFSRRGDQAMMSDLAADMVRRSHPEASKGKSRTSRSTGGEPAAKRQRAQTESAGVDAEALRRQTLATELLEKKAEVLAIERDLGTEATALSAKPLSTGWARSSPRFHHPNRDACNPCRFLLAACAPFVQ